MNANSFYSYDDFAKICESAKNECEIFFSDYRKKVKEKGNWYELSIYSGRYYESNKYYVSCNIMYSYKNDKLFEGREVGGGNYVKMNLQDYQSFVDGINESLCIFPDYNEMLQLTFF